MSYLNGLVVFPTFFHLSLNLAIRSSWSEPQSAPGIVFADYIELLHVWLQTIYNQSDFGVGHLLMSMCRFFCCWKRVFAMTSVFTLQNCLSLPCFILYSMAKFACYSRNLLTSYFCIPFPCNEKNIFFWVLVLEGLVNLHRTVQLQLLQSYWLGHRLGLLWYWMVCLGNEERSFCCFWDCIQVLHFGLSLTMIVTSFLLKGSCPQ